MVRQELDARPGSVAATLQPIAAARSPSTAKGSYARPPPARHARSRCLRATPAGTIASRPRTARRTGDSGTSRPRLNRSPIACGRSPPGRDVAVEPALDVVVGHAAPPSASGASGQASRPTYSSTEARVADGAEGERPGRSARIRARARRHRPSQDDGARGSTSTNPRPVVASAPGCVIVDALGDRASGHSPIAAARLPPLVGTRHELRRSPKTGPPTSGRRPIAPTDSSRLRSRSEARAIA